MKNSKTYAAKIQKLYRSLKRKSTGNDFASYEEPAHAAVYAVLAEHLPESTAQTAYKKCFEYFVDLNEIRVSRAEEIASLIGPGEPRNVKIAAELAGVLRAIFNAHHKISLEPLKKMGKRPAKQALEKMGFSPFVVDYCMLTAFQGHAIPLNNAMVEFLKAEELVYPSADAADIGGFLTKQISAREGHEFYMLLRLHCETAKPRKKKKVNKTASRKDSAAKPQKSTAKRAKRKELKKK